MTAPSSGKKSGFKAFLGRHEFLSSVLKVISGTGVAQLVAIVAVLWLSLPVGLLLAPDQYVLWAITGGIAQGGGHRLSVWTRKIPRSFDWLVEVQPGFAPRP